MNRREFLIATGAVPVALGLRSAALRALAMQDLEWVRAWERDQKQRPRILASHARIAPVGEPGTPLMIHGRLFRQESKLAASSICVFAYHTDRNGIYADKSAGPHVWRLRGWAQTDAEGRFEFETIRPAPYPGHDNPAHIHMTFDGPGVPRRYAEEFMFDDDPLVTKALREASAKKGPFGGVRTVEHRGDVQHVNALFRLDATGLF